MAKNIEININNGSSYEVLYPKIDLTNNQGTNLPLTQTSGNLDLSTRTTGNLNLSTRTEGTLSTSRLNGKINISTQTEGNYDINYVPTVPLSFTGSSKVEVNSLCGLQDLANLVSNKFTNGQSTLQIYEYVGNGSTTDFGSVLTLQAMCIYPKGMASSTNGSYSMIYFVSIEDIQQGNIYIACINNSNLSIISVPINNLIDTYMKTSILGTTEIVRAKSYLNVNNVSYKVLIIEAPNKTVMG